MPSDPKERILTLPFWTSTLVAAVRCAYSIVPLDITFIVLPVVDDSTNAVVKIYKKDNDNNNNCCYWEFVLSTEPSALYASSHLIFALTLGDKYLPRVSNLPKVTELKSY